MLLLWFQYFTIYGISKTIRNILCSYYYFNLFGVFCFVFVLAFTYLFCVWGGDGFVGRFSPFTLWTLEVKLRLDSKHLYPEPSHQALCFHILWFSFLYKQLCIKAYITTFEIIFFLFCYSHSLSTSLNNVTKYST